MLLTKKIKASGIAEVVIALSVIALCFTVASLVFIRSTTSPMKFHDVKKQTEIQSTLMMRMMNNDLNMEVDDVELSIEEDEFSDSLKVYTYLGSDERVIWRGQMKELKNEGMKE